MKTIYKTVPSMLDLINIIPMSLQYQMEFAREQVERLSLETERFEYMAEKACGEGDEYLISYYNTRAALTRVLLNSFKKSEDVIRRSYVARLTKDGFDTCLDVCKRIDRKEGNL